jgi:uncharacterized tellurite resistance protein B-like protein
MNQHYQLGLLYLTHLLISADGVVDQNEADAIQLIKEKEGISNELFAEFENITRTKKEREIFQCGLDFINKCNDDEKLRVFVTLYKLSEVDGRVHVKEIRLLLYSIKIKP